MTIMGDLYQEAIDKNKKLEARIRRLRALVREMDASLSHEWGVPESSDEQIEREEYPTIERGDMTEE